MALYKITTTPYLNAAMLAVAATVKSTRGSIYTITAYNPNASVTYLQIFDSASVTVGSTVPKLSIGIPAAQSINIVFGSSPFITTNSIKIAATTTALGSTAQGTAITVNILYS